MTEKQRQHLSRARRSLAAGRRLLDGFPDEASGRAYYAMFHSAMAALAGEGVEPGSHSATISAFGFHFARTAKLPVELHRWLIDAESDRLCADYWIGDEVGPEEAAMHLERAEKFLSAVEGLLGE